MERAFFINRNLTSSIFDTSTIYANYCTRALFLKNSIRRPGAKNRIFERIGGTKFNNKGLINAAGSTWPKTV